MDKSLVTFGDSTAQGREDVPVIAVTAHALVTEHERFLKAGCNACISKPSNFKLLKEEIERWFDLIPEERSAS